MQTNAQPALAQARPPFIYRPAHYVKQFHADHADAATLAALVEAAGARNWAALHNSKVMKSIGGQIQGLNGEPLIGYTIRVEGVTDPTLVLETVSGSEPAYGPSGWEIKVADGPNSHVYRVTLYQNDRRVSDPRQVAFPNDCGRNLGIMNFDQLTPLE